MLSEDDMKKIEEAKSNILRGNDIESAALILEKVIWDNLIIVSGRVDITKVAVRQILNFIKEYKDKGYLDVVREKVKANEEITKLQKENEELKTTINKQSLDISNNLLELQQKDKQIDELVKYIDSNNYVDNEECQFQWDFNIKKCIGNGDCKECIKQYFETKAKKGE